VQIESHGVEAHTCRLSPMVPRPIFAYFTIPGYYMNEYGGLEELDWPGIKL